MFRISRENNSRLLKQQQIKLSYKPQATIDSGLMPHDAEQLKSSLAYKAWMICKQWEFAYFVKHRDPWRTQNICLDVRPNSKVAIHGGKRSNHIDFDNNEVFGGKVDFQEAQLWERSHDYPSRGFKNRQMSRTVVNLAICVSKSRKTAFSL